MIVSKELKAYIDNPDIRRAVNFVINNESDAWVELSKNDFEQKNSEQFFQYSSSWIYAQKVQKDYFDLLYQIWDLTWRKTLKEVEKNIGKSLDLIFPTSDFCGVNYAWKNSELEWGFEIATPSNKKFNEIWFYILIDRSRATSGTVAKLGFQIGRDNYSYCGEFLDSKNLSDILNENWEFVVPDDEEKSEGMFVFKSEINLLDFQFSQTEIKTLSGFLTGLTI